MHLLEASPEWFPYFGNQKRFTPFVLELLIGLGAKRGDTFFETNAGSHAISYAVNQQLGLNVTANDLGAYSYAIGNSLLYEGRGSGVHNNTAARGAALITKHGYNPPADALVENNVVGYWLEFINSLNKCNPDTYKVIRGDLFEQIIHHKGDFIYCDFAWPWRDGTATQEYETTSDTLGQLLGDTEVCEFKVASARRILQDVIHFLDLARQNFRYVILSNQSSNYPTPEVIEAHMKACGHTPMISRRQTVPAEEVDNLGKDTEFTEYQYIFTGY